MASSDSRDKASGKTTVPPVVCCDYASLKALSKGLSGKEAREFEKLALESFIRYTPSTIENLQQARAEGRNEDAARFAHSLQAAARMFGSTQLLGALERYHEDVCQAAQSDLDELEKELCLAYAELMRAVRRLYSQHLEQQ